jgi:predicted alpha/beta hydrolase
LVTEPRVSEPCDVAHLSLRALDGYELGASLFTPRRTVSVHRVAVLHGGAGIPAVRYRHFARYLAAAGIPVLTYDYRGMGRSRSVALRGFRASFEDWAEYDLAGAIAWLRAQFPRAEMTGIAHSIGSLLAGGAGNADEQARLVMIGAHTGYYGDYIRRYRLPMIALWHGVMPLLAVLLGYFPARRLGLGEDLPEKIALQWAGRRSPELRPAGTAPDDQRVQTLLDRCATLQRPVFPISVSDDAFATAAGTRRLLSYYPRLSPQQHIEFTPVEAGVQRLGHFGFFSRKAGAALWPRLLAQLNAHSH